MPEIIPYEKRMESLMAFLKAKANVVKALVPKHQDARRMAMVLHQCVQRTPKLLECSWESLVGATLECFRLGLEPGGVNGEAALVPCRIRGTMTACLWPMYKGLARLAYNSGQVAYIAAEAVYEGDKFEFELGTSPFLKHGPSDALKEDAKITHFYAVLHLRAAAPVFKVLTNADVLKVKARSKAADDGPWVTDYPSMGRKTMVKRILATAPLSAELQRAIGYDDLAEVGKDQGIEEIWDVPVEIVEQGKDEAPTPEHVKFVRSLRSQWQKKVEATYVDFAGLVHDTLGEEHKPGEWEDKAERDKEEPKWLAGLGKHRCNQLADRLKELLGIEE